MIIAITKEMTATITIEYAKSVSYVTNMAITSLSGETACRMRQCLRPSGRKQIITYFFISGKTADAPAEQMTAQELSYRF